MAELFCPQCASLRLWRSRSRGVGERLRRSLGWKGYRCRDCDWRGMLWSVDFSEQIKKHGKMILVLAAFSVAFILCLSLVLYLTDGP